MRIVCLEDNEGDYLLIKNILSGYDVEITRACTLIRLCSELVKNNYDCILFDLNVMHSDYAETISHVSKMAKNEKLVAITGNVPNGVVTDIPILNKDCIDYLPRLLGLI